MRTEGGTLGCAELKPDPRQRALRTSLLWLAVAVLASLGLAVAIGPAQTSAQDGEGVDCVGPVGDPEPGTQAWHEREQNNIYCATERHADQTQHPVSPLPISPEIEGLAPISLTDAYRQPERHDGRRFRFNHLTIENRSGQGLAAELYRPCAPGTCSGMPAGLRAVGPKYPGIVVLHGGGSRKELHWWSAQTLAEAGYMAVVFNGAASNRENAEDVLDWLLSTPRRPTSAGQFNPHWRQLDRERIGLAGHSRGGQTASVLGQDDPRVTAIVAWDRGSNLPLPKQLDTPTLFFVGDYECQENPVCQPEPYPEPPGGEGPGERGTEYDTVQAAGVESMKVVLRASTHLDWTLSEPAGNRYAETVSVYFTLSWFDRYLKGAGRPAVAMKAFRRLVAPHFDGYADRHNISQGFYDPAQAASNPADPYAGNVPYEIAGLPIADRLSFHFPSKCFIRAPAPHGGLFASDDMRKEGCPPARARSGRCARLRRGTRRPETLRGTPRGDRLLALGGRDRVLAFAGRDCLIGGPGADVLDGGKMDDRLEGGRGHDRLLGGDGGDTLGGGDRADLIRGGPGADRLFGGDGKDRFLGGGGKDSIDSRGFLRDRVKCGGGRDKVRADRLDIVARDCERVIRS